MPLTRSHYLLQDEVAFIIIVYICVCTIRLRTTRITLHTSERAHYKYIWAPKDSACSYAVCFKNVAARMIATLPPYSHISDYMISELRWLSILAHVRYKVLLLVDKSQQGLAPKCLCELLSKPPSARSSRPLRSADRCDLLIPWSRTSLYQNRAFAVVGPALWNDSPPELRSVMLQGISSASLRSLKTFIFTSLSR